MLGLTPWLCKFYMGDLYGLAAAVFGAIADAQRCACMQIAHF